MMSSHQFVLLSLSVILCAHLVHMLPAAVLADQPVKLPEPVPTVDAVPVVNGGSPQGKKCVGACVKWSKFGVCVEWGCVKAMQTLRTRALLAKMNKLNAKNFLDFDWPWDDDWYDPYDRYDWD